jgi:outer membrane receptor protein involved in Fe transport
VVDVPVQPDFIFLTGVGWIGGSVSAQNIPQKNSKKVLYASGRFIMPFHKPNKLMNNSRRSKLGFFRAALALGGALSLAVVSSAVAQDAVSRAGGPSPGVPAPNAPATSAGSTQATTERIIVTGSNIPTAEEVGPNPVLTFDRATISKSGERNTEELLRNLPIANANGVPVSNNENGTNTAVGAATIALRGFDARATLILLDGRRVAPYPMGNNGGVGVGLMFVDLNSIPQAAIESIEILKDGASTTYGADAVAGVVNIKLRHDYDGAEASMEYGNTLDKDSGEYAASMIFGAGNKDTNVTGIINFYHRNAIANHDRGFSNRPPFLSSNTSPYNLQLSSDVAGAAGGQNLNPGGTEFAGAPNFTNGLAPAGTYLYDVNARVRSGGSLLPGYNFNQFSLSFPETERYGGYVSADHKFFGDQMVLYADMFYQNVKTHNEAAPPATGSFETKGQTTLAIPPNTPLPGGVTPPNTPTYAETGVPLDAFNPFNPFNQIISGGSRARLAEFGNRLFDNETDAFLTTVGVKGDKLFDGTWGYDAAFRYSQIKNTQTGQQVSISRFNRIVNQADPIFDPTSPQYIGTTVAFNPFGDYHVPIPSNQATVAFATVHPKDEDISKLATLDATIYTTELFKLPAGGVGFAFGGQFRRESLDETPDALNVAGDIAGNSPVPVVSGGRKSYAFYSETDIPIFSPANRIPGFYALEVTGAARFENFENNDTNVLVPKVGLRWQPLDEQLTIRATWGEGFRQPSLEELFAAPISTLEVSHDPQKGGLFESETNTLITSNSNLQPEDSRSFSGGVVYTPKYVPGLTLSVDLWDIERTGVVAAPTADQVLQREASGTLLPGESVERDTGGFITRIIIPNQNLGAQEARGLDFGLQYQKETRWGVFTSTTQATYLDEFLFPSFESGNLAGRTTDPGASNEGYYKWRGNSRLDWALNSFDVAATVHYIDGFHEYDANLLPHYVHQEWLVDVQGSYDFSGLLPAIEHQPVPGYSKDAKEAVTSKDGTPMESSAEAANYGLLSWQRWAKGTTLTLGCNNVFGQDPPRASGEGGNGSGYPGFTYDATGRFVYVRLTKKF